MSKHEAWLKWLKEEQERDYYKRIEKRVKELERVHLLYPEEKDRFSSLNFSDITQVKVVITESRSIVEPYAADGLAWSSLDLPTQPMLLLYRRLYEELGIIYDQTDHSKQRWADQGVLLLPIELTSFADGERHETLWEDFTFSVLQALLYSEQPRFFLLLDEQKEWRVLKNPHGHPILESSIHEDVPLFFSIQQFLERHYETTIDWT